MTNKFQIRGGLSITGKIIEINEKKVKEHLVEFVR